MAKHSKKHEHGDSEDSSDRKKKSHKCPHCKKMGTHLAKDCSENPDNENDSSQQCAKRPKCNDYGKKSAEKLHTIAEIAEMLPIILCSS